MSVIAELKASLLHLLFPHVCCGCGAPLEGSASLLCLHCHASLPETGFERMPDNPVEKKFWGRIPVEHATAQYYFTAASLMQELMHQFKYRRNRDIGKALGKWMGIAIRDSRRIAVDALVPLPLFRSREKRRGYNQAAVLCEGMAEELNVPVLNHCVIRSEHTESQTRRGRVERWQNIAGKFVLRDPIVVKGKQLLLVDDVITTGATLEACGSALLEGESVKLSIAALCCALR